eukprot:c3898_g1_i1.p1 GENE.c3898_g1_i1~~c3898_g1_i1.p1  ORF type:complete len:1037 (-),score=250.37 c3898_g1_i1:102-3212(-)
MGAPSDTLAQESVLLFIIRGLGDQTKALPPLRRSFEEWAHSLCGELVKPTIAGPRTNMVSLLLDSMLETEGAAEVICRHFHPHEDVHQFVAMNRRVGEVALKDFHKPGVVEIVQSFNVDQWLLRHPPVAEITAFLETCSRTLSATFRVAAKKFAKDIAQFHIYSPVMKYNPSNPQHRLSKILDHQQKLWCRAIVHMFPTHLMQGTKWLLDASAKQLTPASLWLDVIFTLETKVGQLSPDHVLATLTLIRKHLHLQRKETSKIFDNWSLYLEHLLTFVDVLVAPQFAKASGGSALSEELAISIRSLVKMCARIVEEFVCVAPSDAFDWEADSVQEQCNMCITWLQQLIGNVVRSTNDSYCFNIFWESYATRVMPRSRPAVALLFRVPNFSRMAGWSVPVTMLDPEVFLQMAQISELFPASVTFLMDLFFRMPLPDIVPANVCAPIVIFVLTMFRVMSIELRSRSQNLAGEKLPILVLLRRCLRHDWRYVHPSSMKPMLADFSKSYTTFFHGCNFSSKRPFVPDLAGHIPAANFSRSGCGFLATVLFLRHSFTRSPHSISMYLEYLSECILLHTALTAPDIESIQVLVNWLIADFRHIASWINDSCPKVGLFYRSTSKSVAAVTAQPLSNSTTMPIEDEVSTYAPSSHFCAEKLETLPMGFTDQPSAKQRERLVSLWHPITTLFNIRLLDQLQYINLVSTVLAMAPLTLGVSGLASACVQIKDVQALSRIAEVFFEAVLCWGDQPSLTIDEALIAWEDLRAAMRFPETDEANFLSSAQQQLSFFVLVDYVVQRRAVGDIWNKIPPAPHEDEAQRAARARSSSKGLLSVDRSIQGLRMTVQWCRTVLPQPPLPIRLADKCVLLYSLTVLMATQTTVLVIAGQAAAGKQAAATAFEQTRELLTTLATIFFTLCQQGERGGFFQKLTQKPLFSIELCLLLRVYGTFAGLLVMRLDEARGLAITPSQTKDRIMWIEKLTEFKKLKTYQQHTDFIDTVLAVLPKFELSQPMLLENIREIVSRALMSIYPLLSHCAPLWVTNVS